MKVNILLIDSDKYYLHMVEEILQKKFHDVHIFTTLDGREGIKIAQKKNIDLILSDLHMPSIRGTKIAKILQHTKRTKDIHILFVTSSTYEEFQLEGFEVGSVDYLSKPIDANLLINRVGFYLTFIVQNKILNLLNHNLEKKVHTVKDKNRLQEKILIHQSKTSVMGDMIGAIAHQWRQPLNIIATSMLSLETKAELNILTQEEIMRVNEKISTTLQLLSKTIDNFRNFFITSTKKEMINIVDMIDSTIALVQIQFQTHGISINFEYDKNEEYMVEGYYNEFRQVILNIFANTKDAIEKLWKQKTYYDGKIDIKLTKNGQKIEILICDNSGGIPKNIIKKIFNPYFTTKFAEQGTGMGLYLSKIIIEKIHFGSIVVCNKNDGACFVITI